MWRVDDLRVYEKSGQNKAEGDKNQARSRKRERGEQIRSLDSRCAMNSRADFFLASERKDRAGTAVSSLGIKKVLSPGRI